MNFYSDVDPFAAAWLRELIKAGHIAPGIVDERSIEDITPDELKPYTQCHFFAGIGGWPFSLRLAGWPDDRPVWTGSCPCQPYSVANVAHGGCKGSQDPRHLLPAFARLIREREVECVFGEQVGNAIGKGWLDELHGALPAHTVGAVVLPARAFGADHERKRLFWLADARRSGRAGHKPVERVPIATREALAFARNGFLDARRVMAHDYGSVLPCDGLSVVLERSAAHGYGNAIVPQVAAAFVTAAMDSMDSMEGDL